MRKQMIMLAILGLSLLLSLNVASPVSAGITPSPWQPQINQLNSMVSLLEQTERRLIDIYARFGIEPVPWQPGLNGAVGELNAMTSQLEVQAGRIQAVLSKTPDPYNDLREPLAAVNSVAVRICERLTEPWDDMPPDDVLEAMRGMQLAAQEIVDLTAPSDVIP